MSVYNNNNCKFINERRTVLNCYTLKLIPIEKCCLRFSICVFHHTSEIQYCYIFTNNLNVMNQYIDNKRVIFYVFGKS